MGALLLRLIPWPYLVLVMAALAAVLVGIGWSAGTGHVQAEWDAAKTVAEIQRLRQQNAAVAEALLLERRAAALGQKLAVDEQTRAVAREGQTKIVMREVVRYVEREKAHAAAGGAVVWLDADWVRAHDIAAAPPEAGAEPVPVGEAGPATAGDTLTAVSVNYGECYRWRDQVIGWRAWWETGG